MKKKQMLAMLVMLSLLQGSVYADKPIYDEDKKVYYGNGNPITIDESFTGDYKIIIGSGSETATGNITGGNITLNSDIEGVIFGGAGCGNAVISDNMVTVNGGDMAAVYGGYNSNKDSTKTSEVKNNTVIIKNGDLQVNGIVGGAAMYGSVSDNRVIIEKGNIGGGTIAGGAVEQGTVFNNHVEINGETVGETVIDSIEIIGGQVGDGNAYGNSVSIDADINTDKMVCGAMAQNGNVNNNIVNINNGEVDNVFGGHVELKDGYKNACDISQNGVIIKNAKADFVYGGYFSDDAGMADAAKVRENYVVVGADGKVEGELVAGASEDNADVINNKVILCKNSEVRGTVVAAVTNDKEAEISGNSINLLQQADVSGADLYGYGFVKDLEAVSSDKVSNNNLVIDKGWSGKAKSVQNFNNINFNNIVWQAGNDKAILTTDNGNIEGSNFNLTLQNGQKVNVGERMLLFESNNVSGDIANDGSTFNTNLGVATAVEGIVEQSADKKMVTATIKDVKLADQTKLVASNRAVAAAFINQGTDLIADSLDTLSRDGKYGVKTFAAVHGNRSKYDVNSDIKINGWSTIVGVGAENEHNGGDFSWGVFYENGSGNYRTYNDFNNEFFRGDGSLVYNGGGIAARYENSHGVYTEGSLRAGMLKSEMTDALSDGENKYGYESETAYYGAHIGVGKIFSLGDDSDLDVYGKFFHTYTEGDSFNVAGDEFEFDSINSDRLRIGARVTSNKENKFSTYYGLAYEYEFNGDAEMRAAGMKAPTQSLQGSSVMAEIGLNYQPTPDSPWSFDLNMRGYAGERQGGSFNVQATYTF
ncbi:autotransporter outer membrane beta-barrel domain-containing protein [Phascolarctobacterium faecium]|nr:autotransporter outer membrane beta-barrel domain-containing protein [Phascolarctobacterium faecium]MDM8109778.1 autotransporter outer membrane beta-barrel domain-containing protein [Phascolarctobacterium faecium]